MPMSLKNSRERLPYIYGTELFLRQRTFFGIPAKPSIRKFACFSALDRKQWQESAEGFATALKELMLRYFCYYGPATLQDFSHWSGLPAIVFREVFELIEARFAAVTVDKQTYYTFSEKYAKVIPARQV